MGHQRDYSEGVAEVVDEEVRRLIENAHDEAWEILVENRDVLDHLVLELLEKETLDKAELADVFAGVRKRPEREVWLSSSRRPVSDRPPVSSPTERLAPERLERQRLVRRTATRRARAWSCPPVDEGRVD